MLSKSFYFACLQNIVNLVWKGNFSFPCSFNCMDFDDNWFALKVNILHYVDTWIYMYINVLVFYSYLELNFSLIFPMIKPINAPKISPNRMEGIIIVPNSEIE